MSSNCAIVSIISLPYSGTSLFLLMMWSLALPAPLGTSSCESYALGLLALNMEGSVMNGVFSHSAYL